MLNILKYGQRFSAQYRKVLKNVKPAIQYDQFVIHFHNGAFCRSKDDDNSDTKSGSNVTPTIDSKFDVFNDDSATIILDIEEEREKILAGEIEDVEDTTPNIYTGLNIEHGKTGVFDIEDLVAVLKRDNAENIFVCSVPKELKYVDYLVVITARSQRHMKALAEFVRKIYKVKCDRKRAFVPRIEGKNSDEWMAIDLGNIALHIFSAKVRKQYDLEMLWSVGAEYDNETNKPDDPIFEIFDQHSIEFNAKSQFENVIFDKITNENTKNHLK
ncbi:uncharacterized protein LOC116349366 [Contarinia nasturtii]|uniref:uncharacterized protein LOC116349366 n=1 Tax=Contarinia nasturtii TaxID=265458 RepID=UPI0012D4223C|nr:uncharacterized protein LOC116349366 [Contarinia nasturtii]